MIKFFHHYKKSLVVALVVSVVCLVMTGFGIDFGNSRSEVYAIKIDDTLITHSEYYDKRRAVLERYRSMLGEAWQQFEKTLTARLNEDLAETLISDSLLERFSTSGNIAVSETALQGFIVNDMFGGAFDPARYGAFLRQTGLSSAGFEHSIRADLKRKQLSGFMSDTLSVSEKEAQSLFELDETARDAGYVEFKPEAYISAVAEPAQEVLQKLYEDNMAEYEQPARISYSYVALDPASFRETVEVLPEDIEFFYSENQERFTRPEEIQARHIQFNLPKELDAAKTDEMKKKAEEILAKARAGEPFDKLASQHSQDVPTALNGGDLGWIKRGRMSKEFDRAAFKLNKGDISELVSTDYGYEIIKVEDKKDATPRDLEEVRSEIEREIREREAPAFASVKAHELLDAWKKGGKALAVFGAENKLSAAASAILQNAESDPNPLVRGLTKEILKFAAEKHQLVELSNRIVLAEVSEFKEPQPPSYDEIKDKLTARYKNEEAKKVARQKADALLGEIVQAKYKDLAAAAKEQKLELKEQKDLKRKGATVAPFSDQEIRKAVFSAAEAGSAPSKVFEAGGRYYLLQISAARKPDAAEFAGKRDERLKSAGENLSEIVTASLVNKLKSRAEIDIDPSIMTQDEG